MLEDVISLYDGYLPENTELSIQENSMLHPNGSISISYTFRLRYTSEKSKRVIYVSGKGDSLPKGHDNVFYFYLRQIVLSQNDLWREFSSVYYRERRARQQMFLEAGKNANIRVSEEGTELDRMNYEDTVYEGVLK